MNTTNTHPHENTTEAAVPSASPEAHLRALRGEKDDGDGDGAVLQTLPSRFIVQGTVCNPVEFSGSTHGETPQCCTTHTRREADSQAHGFHRTGLWVEIYDDQKEVVAGPFDPDKRFPRFLFV